jgi:acetyl-CoA C-acetyltransferase/acetyl-CoA acyltransferase 2
MMLLDSSRDVLFLSAKRTAFGAFGGALKELRATDLGTIAAQAALAQAEVRPDEIDEVIFGNVLQTTPEDMYCARHIGLRAGLPVTTPALTVNRLCGSGFQSIVTAAQEIRTGDAEMALVGGTESMSQAPHVIRGARWGYAFGKAPPVEDLLWTALTDTYAGCPMGVTAETVAERHGIDRDACDAYALQSQKRWAAADEAGRFREEIAPVELRGRKGATQTFARDEHPRPQTTLEGLTKLAPVFKADGTVTAGNASGIADGAAAMVVASRAAVERTQRKPLGRLVASAYVGVDPKVMGIGPVPAIAKVLSRAQMRLAEMDLIEVNEAFAPQYLAVEKEAGLPREKTNVDGGAIALGHPLGASGARIVTHLLYELRRRKARHGLGAACIGGGQGIAVIVESLL